MGMSGIEPGSVRKASTLLIVLLLWPHFNLFLKNIILNLLAMIYKAVDDRVWICGVQTQNHLQC